MHFILILKTYLMPILIVLKDKKLSVSLCILITALQFPVWFAKGGWLSVWQQQDQLKQLQAAVIAQQLNNAQLKADVDELSEQSSGQAAIEERARYKLGLLKNDEVFIQFVQK